MKEAELAAWTWDAMYDTRQLNLGRNDPEPFQPGRHLGQGGCGSVHEIDLNGVRLALKRSYHRKLTINVQKEIDVLTHMSEDRHRHVVRLIGSYLYTEKKQGLYELGLIIWPVARCDLARFMREVVVLEHRSEHSKEDVESAADTLSLASDPVKAAKHIPYETILEDSIEKLERIIGCLADALAWLHGTARVRHRDLKPAQILLSSGDQLWLADFGLSTMVPAADNTATSGTETMTRKYEAPERALGQRPGRAEDVFALGCIYLEIAYTIQGLSPEEMKAGNADPYWSYQAHAGSMLTHWLEPLRRPMSHDRRYTHTRQQFLIHIIRNMLSLKAEDRDKINKVVDKLIAFDGMRLFNNCCAFRELQKEYPKFFLWDMDYTTNHRSRLAGEKAEIFYNELVRIDRGLPVSVPDPEETGNPWVPPWSEDMSDADSESSLDRILRVQHPAE